MHRKLLTLLLAITCILFGATSHCYAAQKGKTSSNSETMIGEIGDSSFIFLGSKYIKKGANTYYCDNSSKRSNKVNNYDQFYSSIEKAVKKHKQSLTLNLCTTNSKFDFQHYKTGLLSIISKKTKKNKSCKAYCSLITDERPFADYERVIKNTGVQVLWDIQQADEIINWNKYTSVKITFTYFNADQPLKFAETIDDVGTVLDQASVDGYDTITLCMYYKGSTKKMEDTTYFNTFAGSGDTNCIHIGGNLLSNEHCIINPDIVDFNNSNLMVESADGLESLINWKSIPITSSKFSKSGGSYQQSNYAQCVYYCKLRLHHVTEELLDAGIPFLSTDAMVQEAFTAFSANKEQGFLGYVYIPSSQSLDSVFDKYIEMSKKSLSMLRLYDTGTDYYILSNY